MRTALFDGDTYVFAASSAAETGVQWDEDTYTLRGDLGKAIRQLDSNIERDAERVGADRLVVALSASGDRFRNHVMPLYKDTRGRKPLVYNALRDYVNEKYETFERPMLEGDDVLGILATSPKIIEGEKVIVAIDKDMLTIPGLLYNPNRPDEGILTITERAADEYFYTQTLTGDTTDGYKGCPGVGPKKAAKILDGWTDEDVWARIVAAFEHAGQTKADALMNAQVARILRACDYDFKKKEVRLWTP